MHGNYSGPFTDMFSSSNDVGQAIQVTGQISHLISQFSSSAVTGAGAQLTYDVLVSGVWTDSGVPPVSIAGSITGTLQGFTNSQIISGVRVRPAGITGGSCAVNSRLIPTT